MKREHIGKTNRGTGAERYKKYRANEIDKQIQNVKKQEKVKNMSV